MNSILTSSFLLLAHVVFSQVALVRDIYPGAESSYANAYFGCSGQVLFFDAKDEAHGYQLWRSDGTEQGTFLLKEIFPSPSNFLIAGYAELNGNIFFLAGSTPKLWKSDGTTAGTVVAKDFGTNNFYDLPAFYRLGDYLYFNGAESTNGQELWRTDGTTAGTTLVKDIITGSNGGRPGNFGSFNGKLFFTARTLTTGYELWMSDGTAQGTVMVKDINPGTNSGTIRNLISTPIGVFFQANDGTNGAELWVSDGTEAGTHMVSNLNPDGDGYNYNSGDFYHAYGNGKVLFRGYTIATGDELFVTDGTEAGTQLLKDFGPGGSGGVGYGQFFSYDNKVIFVGTDITAGSEPWISDGTAGGTALLADINPGSAASAPIDYTIHQGKLYFSALNAGSGRELWVSDGTSAGTSLVIDLVAGAGSSDLDKLASCGNLLFFYANDGIHGSELFRLGGVSSLSSPGNGTSRVSVYPNPAKNWFRLHSNGADLSGSRLEIIHLNGQTVKVLTLDGNAETHDISGLKSGVYLIRLQKGDQIFYGKLIVG